MVCIEIEAPHARKFGFITLKGFIFNEVLMKERQVSSFRQIPSLHSVLKIIWDGERNDAKQKQA